jgi:cytochrome d ubiquinol oxidase subunit I
VLDALMLARVQFAATVAYHFIFAPLSIGLSWFVVWLLARYWRTGAAVDRDTARFWANLFALSFAVGVPTGLAMEFQFGTNWAPYARFVGDIFGPPLAAEVLSAFFIESTFLAAVLLGWNRLSRGAHWFAALLVALAATDSAFWILASNSWMQTPAGYTLVNGHPVLADFGAALFNHSTLPRVLHTVDGALMTGAFFVLGISAWYLLRGRHTAMARLMTRTALLVAFVASLAQLGLGHYHAVQVAFTQPAKLAAFEGLYHSQTYAPLTLFGIVDEKREELRYAIRVPAGLSILAFLHPAAFVQGLDRVPSEDRPPVGATFYPFHLMFYIGMLLIALPAVGLILAWKRRLYSERWLLRLLVFATPLPFIANELGWMTAEIGRQPWMVYGVLRTRDAVSTNVSATAIIITLVVFTLLYTGATMVWASAMRRALHRGPGPEEEIPSEEKA